MQVQDATFVGGFYDAYYLLVRSEAGVMSETYMVGWTSYLSLPEPPRPPKVI